MGILDSLLNAYIAPEKRAMQQAAYEAAAPQRTADTWAQMMGGGQQQGGQNAPQMSPVQQLGIRMPQPQKVAQGGFEGVLPQRNVQKPAEPASPLDRWKNQIDMMMRSGDSTLQKQAMAMMGSYYDKASAPVDPKVSAYGQQAIDMGLTPGTKPFRDMVEKLATTARTTYVKNDGKSGYLSTEEKIAGGLDPDATFVWNASGMPTPVKSSGYTEGQLLASGYASRMQDAENTFTELREKGFDPTTPRQKIGDVIPYGLGSKLQSPEQQVSSRAQNDWITAKLRKESGATINADEFERERRIFFPQPGDAAEVIEAKRLARENVLRGMADSSGGKFKPNRKRELPPLPEGFTLVEDEDNG